MIIEKIEVRYFHIGCLCSRDVDSRCHIKALPYLSIVQPTEGSYGIKLNDGAEYTTGEKGAFIAPSQVTQTITHHVNQEMGQMSARWVFLDVAINGKYNIDRIFDFPVIMPQPQCARMNGLMDDLFDSDNICDSMSICYQLVKLLINIGKEKNPYKIETISEALNCIEKNYTKSIKISQLADLMHMSESNFYAVFKQATGKSPIAYLNDYRLSVASVLLKRTDDSIGKIAENVGIDNQLYFSRLFKKKYLISPKGYREVNI